MKSTKDKQYDVFISHSSKDDHLAIEIYKYLTQNNIKCWLDKCSILPGEPYSASIMKGLTGSRCFMLLYTKNVIGSGHILNEIDNAYNKDKHILTYVVDKTPMSEELNYYLSRPQQIHSYPNYKEKLSVLLSAIKDENVEDAIDIAKEPSDGSGKGKKNKKWWWILLLLLLSLLALGLWLGLKSDYDIFQCDNLTVVGVDSTTITTESTAVSETAQKDIKKPTVVPETRTKPTPKSKPIPSVSQAPKSIPDNIDPAPQLPIATTPIKEDTEPVVQSTPKEERKKCFSVGGVSFTMIKIDGGTFLMGATTEQDKDAFVDEGPIHEVTLADFYVGETEVTQALWYAVLGVTIDEQKNKKKVDAVLHGVGATHPIYYVSYNDCLEFIKVLNRITNEKFRLITEAEWEYVARGGKQQCEYIYSGSQIINEVAWYKNNSNDSSQPVATKKPNHLGIYDLTGNVSEWCMDWYDAYPIERQMNPQGAPKGTYRIYRGGSWHDKAVDSRVTCRIGGKTEYRSSDLGLRLALEK